MAAQRAGQTLRRSTSVLRAPSRTPRTCDEIREVEALFLDSIDAAERTIYVENQFLTSSAIAQRLARRLRQRPNLEAVIVAPHRYEAWHEAYTMRNGRIRFWRTLQSAGVADRVRLVYPEVTRDGASRPCHDPLQGHDRRRSPAAGRIGQYEQSLDGHGYGMRSRIRSDERGASGRDRKRAQPVAR